MEPGQKQGNDAQWTWGGNARPEDLAPDGKPIETVQDILAAQARAAEPHIQALRELVEKAKAVKEGKVSLEELRRFRKRNMTGMVPLLQAMECALRTKAVEYQLRAESVLGPQGQGQAQSKGQHP